MINREDQVRSLAHEAVNLVAARARRPISTYRLQFHKDHLRFPHAMAIVEYLVELGVSDIYASPYLLTRSGADHGYEVVDHSRLDEQLGSREEYDRYLQALQEHGLGQILDIVPNHMSVATDENLWWNDVLENGPSSPYASFFDIDWKPVKTELHGKVLLPILGEQFGQVLEAGQLQLSFHEGAFRLHYFEHSFPIDPTSAAVILTHELPTLTQELGTESLALLELQSIVTALDYLPKRTETDPERVRERQRERIVIRARLARLAESEPAIVAHIARNVAVFNGDPTQPASFDRLDQLLLQQAYRLAHWKTATDEVNYRRFFDINALAAISMEHVEVFETAHRLVFEMLVNGEISGLRIDHIDGLYHPVEYLWRLQWGYLRAVGKKLYREAFLAAPVMAGGGGGGSREASEPAKDDGWRELEPDFLNEVHAQIGGPAPAALFPDCFGGGTAPVSMHDGTPPSSALPLYVVVEKILGSDEPLPRDWPVHGTTGYDFLASANGLLVEKSGLAAVTRIYRRFTSTQAEFKEMAYQAKQLILTAAMSGELQLLAHRLSQLSEHHRRSRDFTLTALRDALREVLACFPVYRTYIGGGYVPDRDRRVVQWAVAQAKRLNPATDKSIFDFIRGVLLLELPLDADEAAVRERDFFVGRFQQVTSPVMAKGIEDTVFYRYFPLVSLNEVGGEPEHVVDIERFHRENQDRQQRWPMSMLASTTHDTKRSEDVRARIAVLGEIPRQWSTVLGRWSRYNRTSRREVDGQDAPSRNDEYLFYQNLLGIWPVTPPDDAQRAEIITRMQQYMEKATHEAKRRTSWINPNPEYDEAVRHFVESVLSKKPKNRFLSELEAFHEHILDAGLYTALSQHFLRLVSPGVPDIYQGQEVWDFSLVDPDNRRPVDFAYRRSLLDSLRKEFQDHPESIREIASRLGKAPRQDALKLYTTWRCLQLRQRKPDLFHSGKYLALSAEGKFSKHAVSFARHHESSAILCVAPRLIAELTGLATAPVRPMVEPLGEIWGDTALAIPAELRGTYRDLFTGSAVEIGATIAIRELLEHYPLALLEREPV